MERSTLPQIALFCTEGGSDKEYHAAIVEVTGGYSVMIRSGKRGAAKAHKAPPVVTYEVALAEFERIVKEKKSPKKGYTEDTSGRGYSSQELAGKMSENRPHLLVAMDASQLEELIVDDAWGFEWKINGERLMIAVKDGIITTSNKLGVINTVPQEISDAVASLEVSEAVLDGESLNGKFYLFDILSLNGQCLRHSGAKARFDHYNSLVVPDSIIKVDLVEGQLAKRALLARVKEALGEGIVAKLLSAPYTPGKAAPTKATQYKFKLVEDSSVFVTAVHPTKRSAAIGLLNEDGTTYDAGSVGIPGSVPMPSVGDVIDVQYRHLYAKGALCEPVFLKSRNDVTASECHICQVTRIVDRAAGDGEYTAA